MRQQGCRWQAFVPTVVVLACSVTWAAGDVFVSDVGAAFAQATESGRPVVIDFFTTWCQPCEQMAQTTWRDEDVLSALARCVPLAIDAERAPGLAARYGATSYPTVVVATADGAVVLRLRGFLDAGTMHAHLSEVLDRWDRLAATATAAAQGNADSAALVDLADFARERQAWEWAEWLYRRALKKRKRLPLDLVTRTEAGLGALYAATGRCREARRLLGPDADGGACAVTGGEK